MTCQECGKPILNGDGYWVTPKGRKVKKPYCPKCFEDGLRRHTRESFIDDQWQDERNIVRTF